MIGLKELKAHKAIHGAQFERKNVLTNDPGVYVDLWLRRNQLNDALFYWRQAQEFASAANGLSADTAPLVLYYAFLNAAKALLASKNVAFREGHGVGGKKLGPGGAPITLANEGIEIRKHGIVPALATYFAEAEPNTLHSLADVLYNLVFVHRSFTLTNPAQGDVFAPLRMCEYVHDDQSGEIYLRGKTVADVHWPTFKANLPQTFSLIMFEGSEGIRSVPSVPWANSQNPTAAELDHLRLLNQQLRYHLQYIRGSETLWYIKTDGPSRLQRQSITLTLAAMHRLSEICRYKPSELRTLMDSSENWLVSEFITMSRTQFFDEVACEITGDQVMIPNVRSPK